MLKKVMAIVRNATGKNIKNEAKEQLKPKVDKSQLNQQEIEFVLNILRDCTFKGTQVVELYNTVLKLQSQHKNLEEK